MRSFIFILSVILLKSCNAQNCFEYNIDYEGTDLNNGLNQRTNTAEECQSLCQLTQNCQGFTWANGNFFGEFKN